MRRDYGSESFDYGDGPGQRPPTATASPTGSPARPTASCSPTSRAWPSAAPTCSAGWGVVSGGARRRPQRRRRPASSASSPTSMTAAASTSARAPATPATASARPAATRRRRGRPAQPRPRLRRLGPSRPRCSCIATAATTDDATTLAATYSLPLGPGALTLRAAQLVEPDQELALTALYTAAAGPAPLGHRRALKRSGDYGARACSARPAGPAISASTTGSRPRPAPATAALEARLGYQSDAGRRRPRGRALRRRQRPARRGQRQRGADRRRGRALSRRIGRAFGLVDLPGFPDVRVYLDNREAGRTDADGRLLLPGLRPYESNRVRLEVDDLPLDAEIDARPRSRRCPFERSGVTIGFPLAPRPAGHGDPARRGRRAAAGRPAAAQRRRRGDRLGRARRLQPGQGPARAAPVRSRPRTAAQPFTCELPAAPDGELLPDLGEVACR